MLKISLFYSCFWISLQIHNWDKWCHLVSGKAFVYKRQNAIILKSKEIITLSSSGTTSVHFLWSFSHKLDVSINPTYLIAVVLQSLNHTNLDFSCQHNRNYSPLLSKDFLQIDRRLVNENDFILLAALIFSHPYFFYGRDV